MFLNLLQPPKYVVPTLASISPKGEVHAFELTQVPDLHDVFMHSVAVSDTMVALLVSAARENKEGSVTVTASNGSTWEQKENTAERHNYIATFDRKGEFQDLVQLDDDLRPYRLGVFPSGYFLISATTGPYRPEQLLLLKNDGTILEYLNPPENYADSPDANPNSPQSKFPPGGIVGLQELIPVRDSIFVVNTHKRPLLEVRDSGAIRMIVPKLPKGVVIEGVIPSDQGLYLRASSDPDNSHKSVIYEVDEQDGSILRQFALPGNMIAAGIACVNNGSFLSFQYGDGGAFIPLTGTPEAPSVGDRSQDSRAK
jgi:hypothetical protein